MEDYLQAARNQGVGQIGFSSHAPLPFPCKWCVKRERFSDYLAEIATARKNFPELEIYSGLEIDYVPGVVSPADFRKTLEYTIGSIHFVGRFQDTYWEIDNTVEVFREGLNRIFEGNVRNAITEYYRLTREMMLQSPPDIVGHLDKIKVNATHFGFTEDETWYTEQIDNTLTCIRDTRAIIEVNTRGIYKKKTNATYPSPWILERILRYNIPITISSDAHHPDDLTREFESTTQLLKEIGFGTICVLKNGTWKNMPLDEYGPVR